MKPNDIQNYLTGVAAVTALFLCSLPTAMVGQPTGGLSSVQGLQCGTNVDAGNPRYSVNLGLEGGIYIPASGTYRVLLVFVSFPDDSNSHPYWPAHQPPTDMAKFIDPDESTNSPDYQNLTNYFEQMSMGVYHVLGEALFVEAPNNESYYSSRYAANRDVLENRVNALVNLRDYDNWTRLGDYTHLPDPDNAVDMIVMIWRGFHWYLGEASLGYGTAVTLDGIQVRFGYPGLGSEGSGLTCSYPFTHWPGKLLQTMAHELGHWLLGGLHPYGNNPDFEGYAMWGILGAQGRSGTCMNAYERERLDWIEPVLITEEEPAILPDFITAGVAYKYHPPNGASNEFFWIENHQKVSIYDDATRNQTESGIWILHQQDVYNQTDNIRVKPSDGSWNWQNPYFTATCFSQSLPAFKKLTVNRDPAGKSYRDALSTTVGTEKVMFAYIDKADVIHCAAFFNGEGDQFLGAFNIAYNRVFSPWSSPNTRTWANATTNFGMEVVDQYGSETEVNFYIYNPHSASPSEPQALNATKNADGAASLTWTANIEPDLSGYNVYRAIYYSGGPTPTYIKVNGPLVTSASFVDNNWSGISIPPGTSVTFRYRVTAVDNQPLESMKSDSVEVTYTWQEYLLGLAYQNKSFSSQSTAFNGQRKLYRESSGKLHEVFASGTINGGEIFYRNSTDNGSTWNGTTRLSDGTATSLAPCITVGPGSPVTVVVVWQQTNGSNYNAVFSRSSNGGSSWSSITSLESNFSCTSPGPLPSASANVLTGGTVVVYRTSSGLRYVYSTTSMSPWYGPYLVPNTNGNYNSPTTAFYPIPSPMADKCNLAFSTGVGYPSQLYYSYCTFPPPPSWSTFLNLSSALPGSYVEHKNPSLAVSSTSTSTVHVAWEATLMAPPTPVIVHRKGSSGNFGSQYNVIQRQYINNPSITGLTSDNAYMVFQNTSSGVFSRIQYFYSGGSWIWDNLTNLYSGNYAQLSVGSSSAKYLWTSGTSSPYTIAIGSEILTKADMLAVSYSRELNFIDSKAGSSISVDMKQPQLVHKDGTVALIPFVDPPPDSVVIATKEIMKYGSTQSFTAPKDMDTLKLQYSVRTIKSENILQGANAALSFDLYDVNTGKVLKSIDRRTIVKSSDATGDFYEISTPAGDIQDLSEGSEISIRPSLTGVAEDSPGMIASLGHIYRYETGGASELPRGAIAEEITPKEYLLEQNYPNPFNPVTQIKYSILEDGYVTLKVFDVLGREVAVLVNGLREAGVYTSEWNAGNHASGVYLARLIVRDEVGNLKYQGVRKLLLAR